MCEGDVRGENGPPSRAASARQPSRVGDSRTWPARSAGLAEARRKASEGWWTRRGSNSRPLHCERSALPAELRAPDWLDCATSHGALPQRRHERLFYHVMSPTYGNGKICYVEIPATDIERSAAFYR